MMASPKTKKASFGSGDSQGMNAAPQALQSGPQNSMPWPERILSTLKTSLADVDKDCVLWVSRNSAYWTNVTFASHCPHPPILPLALLNSRMRPSGGCREQNEALGAEKVHQPWPSSLRGRIQVPILLCLCQWRGCRFERPFGEGKSANTTVTSKNRQKSSS